MRNVFQLQKEIESEIFKKINPFFKFARSECEKRFLLSVWMHSVQVLISTVEPEISGFFLLKVIN
jgi:hypothetical protein